MKKHANILMEVGCVWLMRIKKKVNDNIMLDVCQKLRHVQVIWKTPYSYVLINLQSNPPKRQRCGRCRIAPASPCVNFEISYSSRVTSILPAAWLRTEFLSLLCCNSRAHCHLLQCLRLLCYFVVSSLKCEGKNGCHDLIPNPRRERERDRHRMAQHFREAEGGKKERMGS